MLKGTDPRFPKYLWDLLAPQAKMTLNFFQNATLNPSILTWEFNVGSFNYNATQLGPLSACVIAHNKSLMRKSWDYCS